MSGSEKSTMAFRLLMIAGILVVCNAALLGAAATWFPWIIPTLPGSSDNSAIPFGGLTAVGLICGIVLLLGALMLHGKIGNNKAWGLTAVVFSIPTVIMGGGFIIGFILGIIGGAKAFSWKPAEMQAKKQATTS